MHREWEMIAESRQLSAVSHQLSVLIRAQFAVVPTAFRSEESAACRQGAEL